MTDDSPHLLIVDDEARIRSVLRTTLSAQGFRISEAEDKSTALSMLEQKLPDLVLLDIGLPDGDGLDLLATLRAWSAVPVIILSARGQERDKVRALEGGADDYVTKPFGTAEMLARIRVALRHATKPASEPPFYDHAGLRLDYAHRRVTVDGAAIHLTPTEYKLLAALAQHAGKVVTHGQLLNAVWGKRATEQGHYLRIYMQHLRQKLGDNALQPRFLETITGVGYRLITLMTIK